MIGLIGVSKNIFVNPLYINRYIVLQLVYTTLQKELSHD